MSKGLLRIGFLSLPVLAASFALVGACSSDDDTGTTPSPDASADVAQDATTGADTSVAKPDASDAAVAVDAADAGDAADAALPPLCQLYADTPADAAPAEGPRTLYELIAVRALLAAVDSCEIGSAFPDLEDPPPSQITCFAKQLASVAGCLVGGMPIDYTIVNDENGEKCVPGAGGAGDTVQLGFRNPATSGYTVKDVDFLIALTRKAALSTGMPAADADRLKALLEARKSAAASDAGDGGNFSQSTCP